MTSKQRIHCLLAGEVPDRIGRADAPWPETRARWAGEGLPAGVHFNDHFGMDIRHMITVDTSFRLGGSVVEEGDDYRVVRTGDGGLQRFWKHAGVPEHIEFGVNSFEDFQRLRGRLAPSTDRIRFGYYGDFADEYVCGPYEQVKAAYDACPTTAETFVLLSLPEPYEGLLEKMGDERLLVMMAAEPARVAEMFDAHVGFCKGMVDLVVAEGLRPDGVFMGGDIAYKNGLLFSPAMYRELLLPRHRALIEHYKQAHGLPVIYHTDGDCTEAVPLLIEAGIDCLQPLEARTGLDVRRLARRFGDRIAFMGNISVEGLTAGGAAMREEIAGKLRAMVAGRHRYIYHSDHSVPDTVSFANYREAMRIVAECGAY